MRIGLLPLYLELYDRVCKPEQRRPLEIFYAQIAAQFRRKGLEVVEAKICRVKPEFAAAVESFEKAGVDAMVTLHLAYSPSLESAEVFAKARLPVIVLDTTPDFDFSPAQPPSKIMFNHGIHGVQDMCNLLVRNNKPFLIEAGHWQRSDVINRVVKHVRAARMAVAMQNARVGQIGKPFAGMGDFAVLSSVLEQKLGVQSVPCDFKDLGRLCKSISDREIDAEVANNKRRFTLNPKITKAHERSVRIGLAVRRWIEREKLTAFTVNFLEINRANGLSAVPFLEASLAMARGIGYAGEGDVLTAALVHALASVYPQTTFTEMFCPDWKGGTIFLSHMGEVNAALLAGKPRLVEYDFIFGDADNPVKPAGCLKKGKAVFVNLAPMPDDKFRLILAPVIMKEPKGRDMFADSVRGWMKPALPVESFLAEYSRAGGTHHAVLVYGGEINILENFGKFMGWEVAIIGWRNCHENAQSSQVFSGCHP